MKAIYQTVMVLALAGLVIYQSFFQNNALSEVQNLSLQLHHQLDTLGMITDRYEETHKHYLELHRQLIHSQTRAHHINRELTRLSMGQQQDLRTLQAEIQALLAAHRVKLQGLPSHSVDSLLFQP